MPTFSFPALNVGNFGSGRRLHRTWSLQSTSSALSSTSSTLLFVSDPRIASEVPVTNNAWGSFVPVSSATNTLRALTAVDALEDDDDDYSASDSDEPEPSYTLAIEKSRPYSSSTHTPPRLAPKHPLITRTQTSVPHLPSPNPSASCIHPGAHRRHSSELHPVLARLERASKLCVSKMVCSTCQKIGRDFPQCGKCNQMWCSRQCRLVGGQRHQCPVN